MTLVLLQLGKTISGVAIGTALALISCVWPAAADESEMALWRLDCGTIDIEDVSYFSDTFAFDGQSAVLSNGCYLIRHGDQHFLWEAGLPTSYLGNKTRKDGWLSSLSVTLVDQLAQIDLTPSDISLLSVSHFHGDHIGQAAELTNATLLLSEAGANWIRDNQPDNARRRLSHWFEGDG